jgi:16S rRNA processing protein RimM
LIHKYIKAYHALKNDDGRFAEVTEHFVLGVLGAPFGLEGRIKLRPWSGESGHILTLQQALIRHGGVERVYTVEGAAAQGAQVLLKFKGIDSPEAARLLAGGELLGSREAAAELGPDEFYIEDMKGMEIAALPEGGPANLDDPRLETLGFVTDVIEGGGGQVVELRLGSEPDSGGKGELKLVPFRNEFFGEVNPKLGKALLLQRWILE